MSPPSVSSFPFIPAVTAQPWSSPWQDSPSPARVPALKPQTMRSGAGGAVAQEGLTKTLLGDMEDRSPRLKLEENVVSGLGGFALSRTTVFPSPVLRTHSRSVFLLHHSFQQNRYCLRVPEERIKKHCCTGTGVLYTVYFYFSFTVAIHIYFCTL